MTWKIWLPKLRPDLFYIFNIYDNDFLNFKEHKYFLPLHGNKDERNISNKTYNRSNFQPYINNDGVYTWNFDINNTLPIRFFEHQTGIDAKLIKNIKDISIDDWWVSDSGIEDFLKKYGIVIFGIIMLFFMGFLISRDQKITQLLLNVTNKG